MTLRLVSGLLLFAVIHTALAARSVRSRGERLVGGDARLYRVLYNLVAAGILLGLLVSTRGDYPLVWRTEGVARAGLLGVQGVALAGFVWTMRGFDGGEFMGFKAPAAAGRAGRLETRGPYRLCRHPLYFSTSLFFSAWPTMDARWFVVAVWLWVYSYVGSIFEERKLAAHFGPDYRTYQVTHPRLFPVGWVARLARRKTARRPA